MLPTPPTTEQEKTTGRQAVKRDFNNLDSLIEELNQPKEVIQNSQPKPPPSADSEQAHDYGEQYPGGDYGHEPEHFEPMPDEVANLSGKMIAGTIDTSLSTAMGLYAHNSETEKYSASDKQIDKLNDAWAAVSRKYNYKIEDSPWFNVVALSAGVYIPKFQDAKADRRFAEMDQKFDLMKKRNEEMEARLNEVEKQTDAKK